MSDERYTPSHSMRLANGTLALSNEAGILLGASKGDHGKGFGFAFNLMSL